MCFASCRRSLRGGRCSLSSGLCLEWRLGWSFSIRTGKCRKGTGMCRCQGIGDNGRVTQGRSAWHCLGNKHISQETVIKTDSAFAVGIVTGVAVPRISKVASVYLKNSLTSGQFFDLMVISLLKGHSGLNAEKKNQFQMQNKRHKSCSFPINWW